MRYRNAWSEATVVATADVAANVRQIEIIPAAGAQPYSAGAHLDVSLLIAAKPEIRSYSLIGPYRLAIKHLAASRSGSAAMWALASGARLRISQPQNHFALTFGRQSYMLIAGGSGITPIYGMALELAEYGADLHLLYAGASRAEMPFIDVSLTLGIPLRTS